MKVRLIAASVVLLCAGCSSDDTEALKRAARADVFPETLASEEAAVAYSHAFSVGGHVEKARIGFTSYLVVFEHGSGVPVIRIVVYRRIIGRWRLVSKPEFGHGESLRVEVSEGKIRVRGQRSNQTWIIFDPNEKTNQSSQPTPRRG